MRELKELLKERDSSMKRVAKEIGIQSTSLYAYLNQTTNMKQTTFDKMCRFLGVDDFLINGLPPEISRRAKKIKPIEPIVVKRKRKMTVDEKGLCFVLKHLKVMRMGRTIVPNAFIGRERQMIKMLASMGVDVVTYKSEFCGPIVKLTREEDIQIVENMNISRAIDEYRWRR